MAQFKNFTMRQGDLGPEFHGTAVVTEVGEHQALNLRNEKGTPYTRVMATVVSLKNKNEEILILDFSKNESGLPEVGQTVDVKYRVSETDTLIFTRAYKNTRMTAEAFGHTAALTDSKCPWRKAIASGAL